jgi:dihydroorotase
MLSLQEALKNSQIDLLTTLHHPSSPIHKEVAFFDASYGCEAISDALPLYFTKLVKSGMIEMKKLIELTVKNPAASIGLQKGVVKIGEKAELILFNPNANYTITNEQSLYDGEVLYGEVKQIS